VLKSINNHLKEGCHEEVCHTGGREKLCRSRGGESCAFDGAMIVLQPIADAVHIVHGPIGCCGNSWEGRGTLSEKGIFHTFGLTTAMDEMNIIYGSEEKLLNAILEAHGKLRPPAIFVHSTCVSGLIGEDINAICRRAEEYINSDRKASIKIIPVNAPGFVGPKNLGNRIAGEVLLDHVIGTSEPLYTTPFDINLIGEYNIAGDLWEMEPLFEQAGLRVLSRITGDSCFREITYAHRAKLNLVVCSRALINVAKEMERRYGIPYLEVSFFGKTEIARALRGMAAVLDPAGKNGLSGRIETIIEKEEQKLALALKEYGLLKGKKAVLYTGGVKSWSIIQALMDLGIEVVAVGTKKSTFEDEEKMKEILGPNAPLYEDTAPRNLLRLMHERQADILVAGGRNQYLAIKEGFPFVDVNQERHIPYAGYVGLVNLAEEITKSIRFFEKRPFKESGRTLIKSTGDLVINPLRHSQSVGAAMAIQGIDRALPIIHGAQGCSFLQKVLLTKHFREPIALMSTKLFTEEVVMGSEDKLCSAIEEILKKQNPGLVAVLTSGLSEIKGDDLGPIVNSFKESDCKLVFVNTPDFEGGLEEGYANAIERVFRSAMPEEHSKIAGRVNILAGSHLTPADFNELKEITRSFGLSPIVMPDLSSLDGSRECFSPLAAGGITLAQIEQMAFSEYTLVLGKSLENAAKAIKEKAGIDYRILEIAFGLAGSDEMSAIFSKLSGKAVPEKYQRERRILIDGMRDAHFYFGEKKICIALEPDHAMGISALLHEMGARVPLAVIPQQSEGCQAIYADQVSVGDLFSIKGDFQMLISNSHGEGAARRLKVPLYQTGFPVYKIIGNTARVGIGYKGALSIINEMANLFLAEVHG